MSNPYETHATRLGTAKTPQDQIFQAEINGCDYRRRMSGKKLKDEKFGQKMGMDWDGKSYRKKRSLKARHFWTSELW